jgi:gentisate 1,2-dioxygenase
LLHYYADLIVIPASSKECVHTSSADEDTAIFWVSDEPLMKFLGVTPNTLRFRPTKFERKDMLDKIEEVKHEPGAEHRNRLGILLGNESTDDSTLTLTHVLWSLLNVLPAGVNQRPHRHNSVALDLAVYAKSTGGVYTLMGPELDADGWVKNPIRRDWGTGGCFITPPGWWHSHHNESDEDAMVLPIQVS